MTIWSRYLILLYVCIYFVFIWRACRPWNNFSDCHQFVLLSYPLLTFILRLVFCSVKMANARCGSIFHAYSFQISPRRVLALISHLIFIVNCADWTGQTRMFCYNLFGFLCFPIPFQEWPLGCSAIAIMLWMNFALVFFPVWCTLFRMRPFFTHPRFTRTPPFVIPIPPLDWSGRVVFDPMASCLTAQATACLVVWLNVCC